MYQVKAIVLNEGYQAIGFVFISPDGQDRYATIPNLAQNKYSDSTIRCYMNNEGVPSFVVKNKDIRVFMLNKDKQKYELDPHFTILGILLKNGIEVGYLVSINGERVQLSKKMVYELGQVMTCNFKLYKTERKDATGVSTGYHIGAKSARSQTKDSLPVYELMKDGADGKEFRGKEKREAAKEGKKSKFDVITFLNYIKSLNGLITIESGSRNSEESKISFDRYMICRPSVQFTENKININLFGVVNGIYHSNYGINIKVKKLRYANIYRDGKIYKGEFFAAIPTENSRDFSFHTNGILSVIDATDTVSNEVNELLKDVEPGKEYRVFKVDISTLEFMTEANAKQYILPYTQVETKVNFLYCIKAAKKVMNSEGNPYISPISLEDSKLSANKWGMVTVKNMYDAGIVNWGEVLPEIPRTPVGMQIIKELIDDGIHPYNGVHSTTSSSAKTGNEVEVKYIDAAANFSNKPTKEILEKVLAGDASVPTGVLRILVGASSLRNHSAETYQAAVNKFLTNLEDTATESKNSLALHKIAMYVLGKGVTINTHEPDIWEQNLKSRVRKGKDYICKPSKTELRCVCVNIDSVDPTSAPKK